MHNMIVEDEGDDVADATQLMNFLQMHENFRDQQMHTQLLNDLVKHIWIHNGNQGGNA